MRRGFILFPFGLVGLVVLAAHFEAEAQAQQTHVGVGSNTLSNGFTEQIGTNWGFNYRGFSFQFGGASQTPSGSGFVTPGGANFGFATMAGGGSFRFNATLAQGSQRGMNSQSPSVTVMNGQTGGFSDTSQSPFVVGFVPVVGGFVPITAVNPGGPAATTVQLPTFSSFSTSTSVSVPDSGATSLGGVNRAADGGNQQGAPGLPGNRGAASTRSGGGMQVSAKIHDFDQMDKALLGGSSAAAAARSIDPAAQALASSQTSTAGQPALSVAEARRMHEAETRGQDSEAQSWFDRGQTAEQEGNPAAARIYYGMAFRHASSGSIKATIQARLSLLRADTAPTLARKPSP
jgi:hypothetical protein